MRKIHICRKHTLNVKEREQFAQEVLDKLQQRFGGECSKEGSGIFAYRHSKGLDAALVFSEKEVKIEVVLGFMMRVLAPKIEGEINRVLDERLDA